MNDLSQLLIGVAAGGILTWLVAYLYYRRSAGDLARSVDEAVERLVQLLPAKPMTDIDLASRSMPWDVVTKLLRQIPEVARSVNIGRIEDLLEIVRELERDIKAYHDWRVARGD